MKCQNCPAAVFGNETRKTIDSNLLIVTLATSWEVWGVGDGLNQAEMPKSPKTYQVADEFG